MAQVLAVETEVQMKMHKLAIENQERKDAIEKERAKKQENKFVQITDPYGLLAMRAIYNKSRPAGDLFNFMIQYMDRKNCLVCSMNLLGEALNKSRQSIYRSIKILADNNFISIAKLGNTNAYYLNSDIVWKAWRNGKPYAKCHGTILLSLTEQDVETKKRVKKQLALFQEETK